MINNVFQFNPSATWATRRPLVKSNVCGLIVRLKDCDADPKKLSVTPIVKVEVAFTVGVPEITPEPDSDSPAGSVPPIKEKEYGGVPPVAVSVCE